MSGFLAVKRSVLITHGASGFGLSLAKKLVAKGHEVIVLSKHEDRRANAKKECPELIALDALVSTDQGRKELAHKIQTDHPQVSVLINTSGVSRHPPPLTETTDALWQSYVQVVDKTLMARMHLSLLFAPFFVQKSGAMIVNVSTIAALYPSDHDPVYSAAAAAVHSFTVSLRNQLQDTSVKVVEVIPPFVETDKGPEWIKGVGDVTYDVYAQSVVEQLVAGDLEIGY